MKLLKIFLAPVLTGIFFQGAFASEVQKQYLVFAGGGVKGLAYAGALAKFASSEQQWNNSVMINGKPVDGAMGSSAGAITSMLVVLDYSVNDIYTQTKSVPWGDFIDNIYSRREYLFDFKDITFSFTGFIHLMQKLSELTNAYTKQVDMISRYSVASSGMALDALVGKLVKNAKGDENYTFKQLYENDHKELYVMTYNVAYHSPYVFSYITSPDMPIKDAVVTSSSLPGFFPAQFFKKDQNNNYQHVSFSELKNNYLGLDNMSVTTDVQPFGQFETAAGKKLQSVEPFVDGGYVNNFPLDWLSDHLQEQNANILGMLLVDDAEEKWIKTGEYAFVGQHLGVAPFNNPLVSGQFASQQQLLAGGKAMVSYTSSLLMERLMQSQYNKYVQNQDYIDQIVFVNNAGVSTTDFNGMNDPKTIKKLLMGGCRGAEGYINLNDDGLSNETPQLKLTTNDASSGLPGSCEMIVNNLMGNAH
jgi:predicted acylesterase/phospholipase RssA